MKIPDQFSHGNPLRIALISPKGPLYRHRGGIWKKSLRYQPLTLTTLAALIPPDLPHTVRCIDEGVSDVPLTLDVDLVGLTVIPGTAVRAYALADYFRSRGITVVLGGPHVTLIPDDARPHADFQPRHMSVSELQSGLETAWKRRWTRSRTKRRRYREAVSCHPRTPVRGTQARTAVHPDVADGIAPSGGTCRPHAQRIRYSVLRRPTRGGPFRRAD